MGRTSGPYVASTAGGALIMAGYCWSLVSASVAESITGLELLK